MSAADVLVGGNSPFVLQEGRLGGAVDLDDIAALPQVSERGPRQREPAVHRGDGHRSPRGAGRPAADHPRRRTSSASTIERWSMVSGRPANPKRANEATASFVLAERLNLEVGSTLRLRFVEASGFEITALQLLSNFGARLAGDPAANSTSIDAPRRRPRRHVPDHRHRSVAARVPAARARPVARAASHARVRSALRRSDRVEPDHVRAPEGCPSCSTRSPRASNDSRRARRPGFIVSRELQQPKVETAIRAEAIALRLVALLVALALVFIVAQGLLRQAYAEARDDNVLHALGMERRELYWLAAARGLFAGVIAAVVAVVVAVADVTADADRDRAHRRARTAASSSTRWSSASGPSRSSALVVGLRVLAAWRVTRATANAAVSRAARRSRSGCSTAPRLPPTADAGMRFALDPGRGSASVPVWTSVLGVTLTIALLAGLWSFQASLRHLLDTPHLYGWNWSVKSGAPALPDLGALVDSRVRAGSHDLGAGRGHRHPGGARARARRRPRAPTGPGCRRSHQPCSKVACRSARTR